MVVDGSPAAVGFGSAADEHSSIRLFLAADRTGRSFFVIACFGSENGATKFLVFDTTKEPIAHEKSF